MTPRDPHRDVGVPGTRPGEGTFPKPSRDDATAASRTEEMAPGASAAGDENQHLAEPRRDPEASGRGASQKPHVTENDEGAPVQGETQSPDEVPVLPANASGTDQVSTDQQPGEVADESAYEGRREEDKDWDP